MPIRIILIVMLLTTAAFSQNAPPIEPGVSLELAKWRAARYSDVRYKLNLTLEKMSPVLKGTMEIRVKVSVPPVVTGGVDAAAERNVIPIILDWRKIKGFEDRSTISNVSVNGKPLVVSASPPVTTGGSDWNEHLIFSDGVVAGENVIKLDFTSPILTSGSAITRYVDKEDGSEYIYSLFVPSDASTAFPVFDQPDIKAKVEVEIEAPQDWTVVSNSPSKVIDDTIEKHYSVGESNKPEDRAFETVVYLKHGFAETKPISTYVFAFAAGPFEKFDITGGNPSGNEGVSSPTKTNTLPTGRVSASLPDGSIYVRKSQAAKFKPHAAEVFRLNREAIRYFEEYFNYKFPWPKYDLVLIPEFPFGGMEHAGATFLRESSIIFPQEPTKNDHISRALLMFHEASHQWFGDTVTMRWFDDLWLKEGFATFTAYKAMEKIMPEMLAWKVFYERVKQAAYQTDSTRGTTAIYQPIANLSAAKSAYGNIVYNKAPAFLRQAEFYLGEDKFRGAVRSFLKKHEFGNAGWEDLVKEFEEVGWFRENDMLFNSLSPQEQKITERINRDEIKQWANRWVNHPGVEVFHMRSALSTDEDKHPWLNRRDNHTRTGRLAHKFNTLYRYSHGRNSAQEIGETKFEMITASVQLINYRPDAQASFIFPNYKDYGYGIFLLDAKSRAYVLKNIRREKDPFLRSMMWGTLWDSVREGELDPREYVELVVKVLRRPAREQGLNSQRFSQALAEARASATEDESTTALLLSRVGTAMNYYLSERPASAGGQAGGPANLPAANAAGSDLRSRVEDMLIERMRNAETLGQRITYHRAFLNIASSDKARGVLKQMLKGADAGRPFTTPSPAAKNASGATPPLEGGEPRVAAADIPLKTKDKFDIVTRLLILGDPEAPGLLADLEKVETSDDAKRYAYAARAGIPTAENKAKYWNDFVNNKEISESWIEAAFGPWNSIRHSELTLPYLERALKELPNHKRNRKIFFVNGWLGAFIGGQRSEEALAVVNKFLADNPKLDKDLQLKILENVDVIERAVRIRQKHDR